MWTNCRFANVDPDVDICNFVDGLMSHPDPPTTAGRNSSAVA